MGTTTNLGLTTNTEASGSAVRFLDWRLSINNETSSNMTILDDFAGEVSGSIATIQTGTVYVVNGVEAVVNNYEATVTGITSLYDGLTILLNVDVTNTSSATLKIGALATTSLYKIQSNGGGTNVESGDLVAGRYNLFVYNSAGGYWVWAASISEDQINIPGSGDEIVVLASSGSGIVSSGISINDIPLASGSYVVMALNTDLDNEWLLSSGSAIEIVQDTAGSTVSVHVQYDTPIVLSSGSITLESSVVTTGSYNKVEVDTYGRVISGSVVSSIAEVSGSAIMSDTTGSVVKHNVSGVTSGSYNQVEVDDYGHVTSASVVSSGTGSGDAVVIAVTQTAHPFADGNAVYFNGTSGSWAKAQSDSLDTIGTHVVGDKDTNTFNAYQSGLLTITGHGLGTSGSWLFVSDTTSGSLVTTEGTYSNPLAQIIDDDTLHVHDFRASGAQTLGIVSFQIDQSGGTSDTHGVLAGDIDGANKVYTVSLASYIIGSLNVYLNGQLQTQGSSEDWTETVPTSGTFTFTDAPLAGDEITAIYQFTANSTGNADTLDGYHAATFVDGDIDYACMGRLTLESGVPISTTDQTDASTLYFTPYKGNVVYTYDSAVWTRHTITETSLDISGFSGSTVYDIFGYDNAGTFALTSGSWSGSAVRDVELTTQDGIYVRTGEEDKRYLGTIYVNDTGVCQDTTSLRYVWNYYNRVVIPISALEATGHTYNGAYRKWNNSDTNNLVKIVIGVSEDVVVIASTAAITAGADGSDAEISIYKDGVIIAKSGGFNRNGQYIVSNGINNDLPEIGYHYYQTWEFSNHASGGFSWMKMDLTVKG